eukprot:5633718-Alexandrium_andersonii.AAC.1
MFGRRGSRAERGDPSAQRRSLGFAGFHRFRARDKDVSPFGPVGGCCLFHIAIRPLLSFIP